MIIIILIIFLSIGIVYNLVKYVDIQYRTAITKSNYISFLIMAILLFVAISFTSYNFYNYILGILLLLFAISGIISKGFNRRGIITTGNITFLAKFISWDKVKTMELTYLSDNYVDLILSTDTLALKHRYPEEYEELLLKIKKELKL
ncbi:MULTISPECIES: hypothetical protein [Helcococcus]|uniref:DUF5673 domain-containing protein n=1 Tax=Helcococcus bovis TaxID=3153252 RepID=A0ABW9F645_9FIRM